MDAWGIISEGLRSAAGRVIGICLFTLVSASGLQASREPLAPTGSWGAPAAALGGAQAALPGAAENFLANPALLSQVRWPEIGAGAGQEDLSGLRTAYVAAALPLFGQVTGGAAWSRAVSPDGSLPETDLAFLALAFPLTRDHHVLTGVNVKYFFEQDTNFAGQPAAGTGAGVDLGFLYKILSDPEGQALQLGLSVCDPQTILKNENYEVQLPVRVRGGLWGRWDKDWGFCAEWNSQSANAPGYESFQLVRLGGEHRWDLAPLNFVALRIGYFQRLDQAGAVTGGVGAAFGDWQADYALQLPVGWSNALHTVSLSWSPGRHHRSEEAPVEDEPIVPKPKPTATPKPQDRIFSALDLAAEAEEERRRSVTPTPTPTPVPKAKPRLRVAGDVVAGNEEEAVYHLSVPQSPADQEDASAAPELEMPGSFSGYLSGLKPGQDNFKIVNQEVRLLVVVNPFSPNHDGRQDRTIFVGRIESERLRMSHWIINVIQGEKVFRTFRGGSRMAHNLEWDGTDERGRVLPDGTYDVLLRVFNEGGLEAAGVTQPVVIRTRLVPIKLSAPGTVTLTGDKQQDAPVVVAIPKIPRSSNWRFYLLDSNRRKVFDRNGSGEVPEKFSWQPRVAGSVAPAGKYRGVLEYRDEVGLKGTAETEFKIGYAAFSVQLKAAPLLFKPGQNAGEGVSFTPDLQGELKINRWTLSVLDEKSDRVWRRLEGEGQLPGSIFWDGRDASGLAVPEGKMFRGVLTATSAVGSEEQAETAPLQSDLGNYAGKQALAMNLTRVPFEADSAVLTEAALRNLQAAVNVLHQNKTDFVLRLLGYCDLTEAHDKDIELSRQRAQVVADYLIETAKIPRERIQFVGYGKDKPLTTQAGAVEQSKNRRVDILLFAK